MAKSNEFENLVRRSRKTSAISTTRESSSRSRYHLRVHDLHFDETLVTTSPRSEKKQIGWKKELALANYSRSPMLGDGLTS
jgi:hypothetical protein